MDDVVARIKAYVLVLYPDILSEQGISDAQLDFFVNEVVDRALVYMNREQLVEQYELDLVDSNVEESDYVLPIPTRLERPLASSVVGVVKGAAENNTSGATTGAVTSVEDHDQKVTFSEKISSYLYSSSDSEVFAGVTNLMNTYIIARVIGDTTEVYRGNSY